MNRLSRRATMLAASGSGLVVLTALLAVTWLAEDDSVAQTQNAKSIRLESVSPEQLRQQLGKPARFATIATGAPDVPMSWRYNSYDPITWQRVSAVQIADQEAIVTVRFNGTLYSDEEYTLPSGTVFHVTDRQIELLSKLPTLRSLELVAAGVTPEQLRTLSSHPGLQVLIVKGSLNNDHLRWIGGFKDLRSLTIAGQYDGAGVKHLEGLRKLVSLQLWTFRDNSVLAGLSGLTWLRFLDLQGEFTDEGLAHLAPLASLEGLRVDYGDVKGTGLKHLNSSTLRDLAIFRTMSDDGLITAGRFVNLRTLRIGGSPVTDRGIHGLRELRNLEQLSAEGTSITGAGLEHLTSLRSAELRHAGITSEGMKSFAGLVELAYLGLDGTKIDGDALKHARGLRNLVKLDARRTKISNESLRHLDALESLARLDLSYCSAIDDGAAPFLGKLTSLKYLQLQETQLTEAALPYFESLRNLKGLVLPDNTGAVADSQELKSLQRALPELGVEVWPRIAP